MYAVIGTAPTVDTTTAVGPYQTVEKALAVSGELEALGYNAEIVPLLKLSDLEPVATWEG